MTTHEPFVRDVALVMSTLDEGDELANTLESVFRADSTPRETLIIDDGGAPSGCDFLEQPEWRARGVRVLRQARQGVSSARNRGFSEATAPAIVVLDAHCRVAPDWLDKLLSVLDASGDSIIAPQIKDRRRPEFSGCGAKLVDSRLRYRWLPVANESSYPVGIAPGGCFAARQETIQRLGGLDAMRELGLEDVELSLRAWRFGIRVLAAPAVKVDHLFRATPHYPVAMASLNYNLARTALIHFSGARLKACLQALIGTEDATSALVDAITSDWSERRDWIEARQLHSIDFFFERFGDWRPIQSGASSAACSSIVPAIAIDNY